MVQENNLSHWMVDHILDQGTAILDTVSSSPLVQHSNTVGRWQSFHNWFVHVVAALLSALFGFSLALQAVDFFVILMKNEMSSWFVYR